MVAELHGRFAAISSTGTEWPSTQEEQSCFIEKRKGASTIP